MSVKVVSTACLSRGERRCPYRSNCACLLPPPPIISVATPAHDPAHLSFFGVCVFGVRLVSVCFEARASLKPAAQQQPAAMPRVVPDQKNKYETDELFKKLSQDVDVSCTDVCMRLEMSQYACAPETSVCVCVCAGQVHGVQGQASGGEVQEGHSVIVSSSVPTTNTSLYCLSPQTFIATGANLNLQFCGSALQDEKPPNCRPSKDTVDLESEPGKVRGHLAAPCMQWLYNTSLH